MLVCLSFEKQMEHAHSKNLKVTALLLNKLWKTEQINSILIITAGIFYFLCIEFASYSHLGQPDGHEIKSGKLFLFVCDTALNVV